jgi:hypothetical protein
MDGSSGGYYSLRSFKGYLVIFSEDINGEEIVPPF